MAVAVKEGGMRHYLVGLSLVVACLFAMAISAQEHDVAAGKLLYRDHCSTCHGMMEADARYAPAAPLELLGQTETRPALAPGWHWRSGHRVTVSRRPTIRHTSAPGLAINDMRLAVAPPYGPSLRGVYGRQAGTVPGFLYSRAFKSILQDVIWNRHSLDTWITDSQAWVPGSLMFYKQPDADMRRQIIAYLEANH